jgi:hypothetical protein
MRRIHLSKYTRFLYFVPEFRENVPSSKVLSANIKTKVILQSPSGLFFNNFL